MEYTPITDEVKKKEWIDWLQNQATILDRKPENKSENSILETPDGDVATCKDLVGNLLATLGNKNIIIN